MLRSLAQDPGAADDDLIASGRRRRRRNTPEDSVTVAFYFKFAHSFRSQLCCLSNPDSR